MKLKNIRKAPFTKEEVDNINECQKTLGLFTCCGHDGCSRSKKYNFGLLKASETGLKCYCGKYKQDWVNNEMADGSLWNSMETFLEKLKSKV